MAETIVDLLEAIEVDDKYRTLGAVPGGSFDLPLQLPLKPSPVVQSGQEIVIDEIPELSCPLFALGRTADVSRRLAHPSAAPDQTHLAVLGRQRSQVAIDIRDHAGDP